MEDRKQYYEYDPDQGGRWWAKEVPPGQEEFQKALTDLAGLNPFGKPILRVSWAGTLLHDITEEPQLKYKLTVTTMTARHYKSTDGTQKLWTVGHKRPDDIDPTFPLVPVMSDHAVGRPRWVIEQWESAASLREKGRFLKLHDADGKKVLRDLPPEGVYNHFFWVQTMDRRYRDLDMGVFTAIQAMWHFQLNPQEAQGALDAIERENTQTLIGAAEAKSIWAGMGQG